MILFAINPLNPIQSITLQEVLMEVCEEGHSADLQIQGTTHHHQQPNYHNITYLTGKQVYHFIT